MNNVKPSILVVDNYDSFTFNLVQIVRECGGCDFDTEKSDRIDIPGAGKYDGFLFSPGPGIPDDAPAMKRLLKAYGDRKSFLGICLGFQAIAVTFGMKLVRLDVVRHGLKARIIKTEPEDYLFKGIPSEFDAGLYHSWGIRHDHDDPSPGEGLRVTALSSDGIIMAVAHTRFNIRGVQFHPESYMSQFGYRVVQNWIDNLADSCTDSYNR